MLAGGFLLASLAFGPGWEYAAGALVGIILTPDLDVDAGNISNQIIREKIGGGKNAHIIRRRIGTVVEKAWDGLWYFYRKSIKHGSELSHFPVISTIGRLAYIYFFALVIPYTIVSMAIPGAWSMGDELRWWNHQILIHYRVVMGLMASDFIHWALDLLTTEHAKKKQKIVILGMPLASSTCK